MFFLIKERKKGQEKGGSRDEEGGTRKEKGGPSEEESRRRKEKEGEKQKQEETGVGEKVSRRRFIYFRFVGF